MIKIVLLVFVGGPLGAMLRDFLMLMVPILSRGFPNGQEARNDVRVLQRAR